jgi:uncharacterized protein YbjT (DUF2867 family)
MRLVVIGASGGVGGELVRQAVAAGHSVTAQTRTAGRIPTLAGVAEAVGSPVDRDFLVNLLQDQDAVLFCLGVDHLGRTTLFSDATLALLDAMGDAGLRRLIAVTGIGAGETRGHGGWFYNYILYPFFTRHRYRDKDLQEKLIAASGLDWTIVRPAPFAQHAPDGPLTIVTQVPPDLQLTRVTRAEVAAFMLDELKTDGFVHQKVFIGHP